MKTNKNAVLISIVALCFSCIFYLSQSFHRYSSLFAQSGQTGEPTPINNPLTVTTEGREETAELCFCKIIAHPSGGVPPYSYIWRFSSGQGGSPTSCSEVIIFINQPGDGWANVKVIDQAEQQATDQHVIKAHAKWEYEIKEGKSTYKDDYPPVAVAGNETDKPCQIVFTHATSVAYTEACNFSLGVTFLKMIEEELSITTSETYESSTTVSFTVEADPGEWYGVYVKAEFKPYSGTFKHYDCDGQAESFPWSLEDFIVFHHYLDSVDRSSPN